MRPVRRGASPQAEQFVPYDSAKFSLIGRIGSYCSYCERRIEASLAVEHIQPKAMPAYADLEGEWTNFLLACVNCNSTKGQKDVQLANVLLPDRDNTYLAFAYDLDGSVKVMPGLPVMLQAIASNLLSLTGLDRRISSVTDDNGKQIVVDRWSKRMEVYGIAREAVADLAEDPSNELLKNWIVRTAVAEGQFSIWMNVFAGNPDVRRRLIDAHSGTRESGCFDAATQNDVSPHPNEDGLVAGGRL